MTWAERFGDLATNVALVVINAVRIVTLLLRIAAEKVDGFVTALAERGEEGISRTSTSGRAWIALPAAVAWGLAAILLRALSVVTVLARRAAFTLDEFLRVLAEGEGPEPRGPSGERSTSPTTPGV